MFYTISGNLVESMTNTDPISNFKISDEYPIGGDCDEEYTAPFDRNEDISLSQCAKKCLENPECKRFSFGKNNKSGGRGLSCRISNDGKCPITIDRYKENNEKGIKLPFDHKKYSFNFWGGKVYDKLSPAEENQSIEINNSNIEINNKNMVKNSVIKSTSESKDIQIVNNKVIKSEAIKTSKEIVNGKVIKDEKIINNIPIQNSEEEEQEQEQVINLDDYNSDETDYTIYYITVIVLIILILSIYYIKKQKLFN